MSPFPNGKNMPETSTQQERKTRAKEDLTPYPSGRAALTSYWSSSITTTHELFHASDWLSFYEPEMRDTQTDIIDKVEVTVDLTNLTPVSVLNDKKPGFVSEILSQTTTAYLRYIKNDENEDRAYANGRSLYLSLANSIIP